MGYFLIQGLINEMRVRAALLALVRVERRRDFALRAAVDRMQAEQQRALEYHAQQLRDALDAGDLEDEVLFVGGTCTVPYHFSHEKPIHRDPSPRASSNPHP